MSRARTDTAVGTGRGSRTRRRFDRRGAGSSIVSVSPGGKLIAPVIFDDPRLDCLPDDPLVAHGQSSLGSEHANRDG